MPGRDRSAAGDAREPVAPLLGDAAFRRLLVPLDGSRLAETSLGAAARLADACDATIVLLHVIERRATGRIHGERHLTDRDEAEAYLAGVGAALAAPGRRIERHTHDVPVGDVARSIAAHAEEHGIDLIVLCTHGEGGLRDALWGSIAQQVLQHSAQPLLLARARPSEEPPVFAPRTIMVPIDGTAASEAALAPAAALARRLGAGLRLVLVVPTVETVSPERMATATFLPSASRVFLDLQEERAAAYLHGLAEAARRAGTAATAEVRRGAPAAELATDTGEHADGLVVIATHGRAGLQAIWTPSVAARLLRRTQAPILLVPIAE